MIEKRSLPQARIVRGLPRSRRASRSLAAEWRKRDEQTGESIAMLGAALGIGVGLAAIILNGGR